MTDLYLIAHKVRGEPAFDVATKVACPECNDPESGTQGCTECDQFGFWWIIPTSGHRAYPCDYVLLTNPLSLEGFEELPDHYATRAAPAFSLTEVLGLTRPKAQPIKRRF